MVLIAELTPILGHSHWYFEIVIVDVMQTIVEVSMEIVIEFAMEIATEDVLETVNEVSM